MLEDGKDVGMFEDFLFMLQHLVAAENHAIGSYQSTGDKTFLEINTKICRIRSKWMYKFIPENKSQIYCLTKHLAGASQGIKEVSNRFVEANENQLAEECFKDAQDIEAIIILLNEQEKTKEFKEPSFINKYILGGSHV